jgi:hypothetical protein
MMLYGIIFFATNIVPDLIYGLKIDFPNWSSERSHMKSTNSTKWVSEGPAGVEDRQTRTSLFAKHSESRLIRICIKCSIKQH